MKFNDEMGLCTWLKSLVVEMLARTIGGIIVMSPVSCPIGELRPRCLGAEANKYSPTPFPPNSIKIDSPNVLDQLGELPALSVALFLFLFSIFVC